MICYKSRMCLTSTRCVRNSQCLDTVNSFVCQCPTGRAGSNCDQNCKDSTDVVFAVDTSGSIGRENFQLMMSFIREVVTELPTNVRVGLETFGDDRKIYVHVGENVNDRLKLLNALAVPYYTGGKTNTSAAIRALRTEMFTEERGSRRDATKLGVIMTDGKSMDEEQTIEEARLARLAGIQLIVIAIGDQFREIELIAIADNPNVLINIDDFISLLSVKERLVSSLCNEVNECTVVSCQNGGTCKDLINTYECICPPTSTGLNCERNCDSKFDLSIVIDRSGSITQENFPKATEMIASILLQLNINQDLVRLAGITFADSPKVEFNLTTFTNRRDAMLAIRRLKYTGGSTNIGLAFEALLRDVYQPWAGDRLTAPNYVLLFTDGEPSDSSNEATLQAAVKARKAGLHVIVIGIGEFLNLKELHALASYPGESNVFTAKDFESLLDINAIVRKVVGTVCNEQNECNSRPCLNGGKCVNGINRWTCLCPEKVTGLTCDRTCSRQGDVVIVIDLSGSMSDEYYEMKLGFIRRIISGLEYKQDLIKVSLVSYSTNVTIRFNLNEYSDVNDLLNAIVFPKLIGGKTNTQLALDIVRTKVLTASSGARVGIQDHVILITDGESNVNEQQTKAKADALKNDGAKIYVAAVGRVVDMNEITEIASGIGEPFVQVLQSERSSYIAADLILDSICT